ncbi:MAG: 50S ribosomal protein L32 [Cytophagales bacterium]|nr:50S ribosomal protein L32 [Bernardetiaceae bacterium]MDW8210825.1 50S ribosomal protein L32 [Cytophagales bacterium]
MANPKRKISRTRRDKRRTHDKLTPKQTVICPTTGVEHLPHRAYFYEGRMYYNGKLVAIEESEETTSDKEG